MDPLDAGLDGLQRGLQRGWHLAGEVVNGESTRRRGEVADVVPPLNDPACALSTEVFTAAWMPLVTLLMKYLQYCAALTQPAVSTRAMLTLPPECPHFWTALAAPRPTLPATGKMMSAPSLMNVWVVGLALRLVVKVTLKEPFWVALAPAEHLHVLRCAAGC